jgi:hypothetical protein
LLYIYGLHRLLHRYCQCEGFVYKMAAGHWVEALELFKSSKKCV